MTKAPSLVVNHVSFCVRLVLKSEDDADCNKPQREENVVWVSAALSSFVCLKTYSNILFLSEGAVSCGAKYRTVTTRVELCSF